LLAFAYGIMASHAAGVVTLSGPLARKKVSWRQPQKKKTFRSDYDSQQRGNTNAITGLLLSNLGRVFVVSMQDPLLTQPCVVANRMWRRATT
jgi:hypothetical protein